MPCYWLSLSHLVSIRLLHLELETAHSGYVQRQSARQLTTN